MPVKSSSQRVKNLQPDTFNEKMWGGTWEEVRQQIEEYAEDTEWFYRNLPDIRKRHQGEYVAVRCRKIIDSDKDHNKLVDRLEKSEDGLSDTQVHFVWPEGTVLIY